MIFMQFSILVVKWAVSRRQMICCDNFYCSSFWILLIINNNLKSFIFIQTFSQAEVETLYAEDCRLDGMIRWVPSEKQRMKLFCFHVLTKICCFAGRCKIISEFWQKMRTIKSKLKLFMFLGFAICMVFFYLLTEV